MPSRTRSFYPWLGAVALAALTAGPVPAQAPSPLELVRGLRENGQVGLALEYLKEIEGQPLSADDKAALLMERAKCQLDISEEEPDEGTRLGLIAQAKEALNAFVTTYPKHPRVVEGLLSIAKLTSLDAKEVLSRARKMDIPPPADNADERKARDQALQKQAAEAAKARPLFQLASKRFAEASEKLKVQLEDKTLSYGARRSLEREAFDAELASGINQFSIAETFMPDEILTVDQKKQRNKFLEDAKGTFAKLGKGAITNRTVWVARAWLAEVTYEQDDFKTAGDEVAAILRAGVVEAEDGKRMAYFFRLRRNVKAALGERAPNKISASVNEMRAWLGRYGNTSRPTPEVFAVSYYLARTLHFQADALSPAPKPPATLTLSDTARRLYEEAERTYRKLAQTDNEYTARASRNRVAVVRKLLGDADQNPLAYATFEKAQMASIIQLGKLVAAQDRAEQLAAADAPDTKKLQAARDEEKRARGRVIALLERARELATPADNPADVTDVLLRLIYFYQQNEQHLQAAVLGDFVAHTVKSTGGKSAIAGLLGMGGYITASRNMKGDNPEALNAARQTDRERAVALARFLDEKYPNDNATDAARHRLAGMLTDDKDFMGAYEILVKVRPGYGQLTNVRLLQGYVVSQLVVPLDKDVPPERRLAPAKKAELFRNTTRELAKVPKPAAIAPEDEVRAYLSARCRLASMMLAQERADPETEHTNAGFNRALHLSGLILAEVPGFDCLVNKDKKLDLDGLEMTNLALDTYTRALYLRARAMTNNGQFDGSMELIKPTLDQIAANGPLMTAELRAWAGLGASESADDRQKARIAQLAALIDKSRVDVVLSGFRTQVRQGKAAEAGKLLDLMVKAGGSLEESLPLLELVGRELAALLVAHKKEGKAEEVKNLGAGLGILLDKIRTVKALSVPSLLFIGQTLQSIGKSAEAIETLKQVPVPTYKDWDKKKSDEFPQEDRGKVLNQIRDYAVAQHGIAQALIDLKRFAEAEKMLKEIVGDNAKPGWGAGRLYFRKAVAELYEAKGTAEPDPKKAQREWGQAMREWTTLFGFARNRLTNLPAAPKEMTAERIAAAVANFHKVLAGTVWFHGVIEQAASLPQARNDFAESYFEVQRCILAANQQLLKAPALAPKLQKTYEDIAKK
ncbi:MAG TPA: hypothetical protein VGE74_00315, partial [Gemmata sp.]